MWSSSKSLSARLVLLAASAALAALLGGCATTDESDMPWNSPQSWEGAPSLPGLTAE